MKCVVDREQLLEPLTRAERTTGKNHTLPILGCVLLKVDGNTLFITATNLEVGVRYSIPVQDAKPGVAAVVGSTLTQVIGTLSVGVKVVFEVSGTFLFVASKEGSVKLALQDVGEFPTLPVVADGTSITLPAHALVDAITNVSYCASSSMIKPELSSVFIHPNGSMLTAASTDSFRLAETHIPLKHTVTSNPFLIPIKSAGDLIRTLELIDGVATLILNEHQLTLTTPNIYLTLRLVNGTFPDYTQIIPKQYATEVTLLRADLERALRKAAIFSDQFNRTTITIEPKKKTLIIHTEHNSIGETTDTITAALEGDPLTINFNHRYLADALHSIQTDSITLQFAGQSQPALVRPVGDARFLYLVMPMNR